MPTLSIIIPVYNERATIEKLLDRVQAAQLPDINQEVIIIDDYSTDGTREILRPLESKFKIIYHEANRGKGAAVTSGLRQATGDLAIIQDADLEYDPAEYQKMLQPMLNDLADVVYGSRFKGNEPHRVLYFWHYLGNRALTGLSNMLTNLNLSDMETGYKAFNRKALEAIKHKLSARRFGIEPQITALISRNDLRIYEVGISYFGRTYQEGKKINWKDGLLAIYYIIRYNFFP